MIARKQAKAQRQPIADRGKHTTIRAVNRERRGTMTCAPSIERRSEGEIRWIRIVLPNQNKHTTQARDVATSSAISSIFNVGPNTTQNKTKRTNKNKQTQEATKRSDVGDDLHRHDHCQDLLGALSICGRRFNALTSTAGFTETIGSPATPRATCRAIQCGVFF